MLTETKISKSNFKLHDKMINTTKNVQSKRDSDIVGSKFSQGWMGKCPPYKILNSVQRRFRYQSVELSVGIK